MKLGQKIYYTHPVSGLISLDGAMVDWQLCLCEIREGYFIERSDMIVGNLRIKIKSGNIIDIPDVFVSEKRSVAEEILKDQTKRNWDNIFREFMRLQGDVSKLKEQIKKIKEI